MRYSRLLVAEFERAAAAATLASQTATSAMARHQHVGEARAFQQAADLARLTTQGSA